MNVAKPREVLLLGPGPSPVHPRVLEAMSWNVLGHMDSSFFSLGEETQRLLRYVYETKNGATFPLPGTGSAGMEAALVNVLEPGDKIVVGTCGYFGKRIVEIADRCGAEVVEVEAEWGKPVDPAEMERALVRNPGARAVAVVQVETSTGILQPVEDIVKAAHAHGATMILDTVASLGGVPVRVDARELDVVYAGSQKCLGCPPGLSPITVNAQTLQKIRSRRTKVRSWYLDLPLIMQYWEDHVYHHTTPVNLVYALCMALSLIEEQGLVAGFDRHSLNGEALVRGLVSLGVGVLAPQEYRSPTLIAALIPEGVPDAQVRARLREEYCIEIAGGLGPLKGRVWRIGLMGNGSDKRNIKRFLTALGETLNDLGHKCSVADALEAVDLPAD